MSNSKQTKQKQKPQQKKKKKKKDANLDKRHTGHGVVKEAGRHAQTVHGMVNDWVFKFNFLEEEGVDAGGHSRARLFPCHHQRPSLDVWKHCSLEELAISVGWATNKPLTSCLLACLFCLFLCRTKSTSFICRRC